ncbi:GDP-mannose 4,6-dehydratase [Candidatus Saccharibacteria bacterium]|nr:GDP-mannose 4,6-dehydratase [Candidatus Saccharibacteria bacterium]MBI3337900.1 GDP-mannose 4,6-dehydratase [Candidatus Saccharibacteria bacterium]
MPKIMVTGVNGFVGKHLVRELVARKCTVTGVGRDKNVDKSLENIVSNYYSCDLTDKSAVAILPLDSIDAVINLAGLARVGESFDKPDFYKHVNVGVLSVLSERLLALSSGARVIAVSTGAVYDPRQPMPLNEGSILLDLRKIARSQGKSARVESGLTEGEVALATSKEDRPLPLEISWSGDGGALRKSSLITSGSPYALSKIDMEIVVSDLRSRGLDCIIARPFNHIGPGQDIGFLVPDLYTKILRANQSGGTIAVGDLTTRRDYTDVRDVVRAYADLAVAPTLQHAVYNVCSGRSVSGGKILELLLKETGQVGKINVTTDSAFIRPNDPEDLFGSNERLHNETGWQPTIPLEQTITDFVNSKSTY